MPQLKQWYLTDQEWEQINAIIELLEPIYEATKLLTLFLQLPNHQRSANSIFCNYATSY